MDELTAMPKTGVRKVGLIMIETRCHCDATPLLHPLISVLFHRERASPP